MMTDDTYSWDVPSFADQDQDAAELNDLARLNEWMPRQPSESLREYGSRVLQHLIAFAWTACFTDDDLQLADHVAIEAYAHKDISPAAVEAIARAQRLISVILKGRAADRSQGAAQLPPVISEPENLGPMAKLVPPAPTMPPAPVAIDVVF